MSIANLKPGDYLKSFDTSQNKWIFSKFVTYLHKDADVLAKYISIRTSFNQSITISSLHLIAKHVNSKLEFVFAKEINLGDFIKAESGLQKVIELSEVYRNGAYAPLTESGTIVVDSVLASCYANTNWHSAAHFVFQPLIKFSKFFNVEGGLLDDPNSMASRIENSQLPENVFWYAKSVHMLTTYIPFTSNFVFF